ncbi:DUF4936 family protein [Rhodocyclaceae bacterium SMB388]
MRDDRHALPMSYYVYYRLRAGADHVEALARITAMQQALEERTGVAGRLLARRDDDAKWMEIYEPVVDALPFEHALQQALESADVPALIEPGSTRHMERFVQATAQR